MNKLDKAKEEATSLGNQMHSEASRMAADLSVSIGAMLVDLIPDRMKLWDTLKPKEQVAIQRHIKKTFY